MARSSPAVVYVPALMLVIVGLCAPACGNDFDALFEGGADATGADAGAKPADSAAIEGGVALSAADARTQPPPDASCGAPAATCLTSIDCVGASGPCTNQCGGCGCTCPKFDCNNDNADRCATTCSAGTTCSVGCDITGPCSLTSHGAVAKVACIDDTTSCNVVCDQGSSCEVDCRHKGTCTVSCAPGTSCLVHCGGDVTSCAVDCQGGQRRECPESRFTCNRDCP